MCSKEHGRRHSVVVVVGRRKWSRRKRAEERANGHKGANTYRTWK